MSRSEPAHRRTCTPLGYLRAEKLSSRAADALSDRANDINISLATIWEIANKAATYRLPLVGNSIDSLLQRAAELEAALLPIVLADVTIAASLPPIHHDPFDRMLVAQAQSRQLSIVTADRHIQQDNVLSLALTTPLRSFFSPRSAQSPCLRPHGGITTQIQ